MAKQRKTRSQKVLADQRHVLYHLETSSAQVSIPSAKKPEFKLEIPNTSSNKHQIATSYAYVTASLRKTAFITAIILTTQIVLFFVLNRI